MAPFILLHLVSSYGRTYPRIQQESGRRQARTGFCDLLLMASLPKLKRDMSFLAECPPCCDCIIS